MGYTELRNTIDRLMTKLSGERLEHFKARLDKMDKRTGGGHIAGLNAVYKELLKELN